MSKEKIKQLLDILTDEDIEILEDAFYISKEVARENIIHYNILKKVNKGFYGIDNEIKKHEYNYSKCNLILSMFINSKDPVIEKKELNKYN